MRALVTGGAKRLGRAMALYLADRGFDVAIHYHSSQAEAERTVADIRARGVKSVALCADILPFIVGYFLNSKNINFLDRVTIFLDKFLKIYVFAISLTGPFELREALYDYFFEAIGIVLIAIMVVFFLVEGSLRLLKIDKRDAVTISIEALCQNFPIVLTFSILFDLPQMAVFGVFYYLATLLIVVPYSLSRPIK